jgi:membrane protein
LGPVLLTAAFTLTSLPQFQATRSFLADLGLGVGALVAFGFRLLPFLILSLAFALLYQLMPNTRVTWRASLVGGVVGGSLWQLNNLVSVLYVSRVVSHDRIYGSLGMVPVFMIGLYFGWLILLFGAQVAYAVQNCRAYLQERQVESVSFRGREFVALRLVTAAGACFERGDKAPSCGELSSRLGIPSRLAAQLLPRLVEGRLLVEVGRNDPGYAPSRPLDRITCHDVLDALRVGQGRVLLTRADAAREQVRASYDRICEAERTVASALTIAELVRLEPGAAGTGLAEEGTVVAGAPSAGGTPSQRV